MDYKSQIEQLREKLDNYSFDSSAYDELFAKAYESLNKAYEQRQGELDETLKADRRRAAMDNTLQTRSLSEQLAARGLAKSGESSLMRINQAISLNNALEKLTANARSNRAELLAKHNENIAGLDTSLATMKATAAREDRSDLFARLEHLEGLLSDEKQNYMNYSLQLKAFEAAEKEREEEKLKAEAESPAKEDADKGEAVDKENAEGSVTVDASGEYKPSTSAKSIAEALWDTNNYAESGMAFTYTGQRAIYAAAALLIGTNNFTKEYAQEICAYLEAKGLRIDIDCDILYDSEVKKVLSAYKNEYSTAYNYAISNKYSKNDANEYATEKSTKAACTMMDSLTLEPDEANLIYSILYMTKG